MTEEGDTQRLLGELVAGSKERAKQLARIELTMNNLAAAQNETHAMVREDRAAIRVLKWTICLVIAGVGALGLDWWQR